MSLRTRFFLASFTAVLAAVSIVACGVTRYTWAALEEMDTQRTEALVAQFKKQFSQREDEVAQQVENITNAEITLRMALDLAQPSADKLLYVHDANGLMRAHGLDFVEIVSWDGTVISSAQDPSRVGHKSDWIVATKDWRDSPPFLEKEQLPDGETLALLAVRSVSGTNEKNLHIVSGRRIDKSFLSSLVLPSSMRALLYRNLNESTFVPADLTDANGLVDQADRFAPLINQIQKRPQPIAQTIQWNSDAASAEAFRLMPLLGRNKELLGILLVGSSRKELVLLKRHIAMTAASAAAASLLIGLLISLWVSVRITRNEENSLTPD